MNERIVKRGQAKKGEEYVVAARSVEPGDEPAPGAQSAASLMAEGAAAYESAEDLIEELPSDRARSKAEQITAEAKRLAREIVTQAQAEAQQFKTEADGDADRLKAETERELEARRQGLEREVRQQLDQEYRERFLAAVTALEAAATDLRECQERYLAEIELPALKLVLAVARQLLGAELSRSPEFIAELIGRACSLLQPEHVVTVAVHPTVFAMLEDNNVVTEALRGAGVSPERVKLEADESLARDKFAARVGGMSVDYDLDAAIDELVAKLEQRTEPTPPAADD